MQVKSIAEWEHSAILSTFIKLPFVIKIFVLSIFSGRLRQVSQYITVIFPMEGPLTDGNGNHSVSLPIILIKIKVDQMLPSSYITSLLVSIL